MKTYKIFNRYYYWPGIINDVKCFVRNCYGCRKNKNSRDECHGVLKLLPVPNKRWFHISIDFVTSWSREVKAWSGQASFANIYVLGRYTRRSTKSKKDNYVRWPIYPPTLILLAFSIVSKKTCLLETHIALKIPVI